MPENLIKRIVGAGVGLAVGVMILFIGFFRTLLLVALGALGWWLCGSRTIPQPVIDWIKRIRNPRM